MKLIIAIAVAFIGLASCARHMNKSNTLDSKSYDSTVHLTDTSVSKVVTKTETENEFGGDSLTGTIYFDTDPKFYATDSASTPVKDSIVSNAFKIVIGLNKTKAGTKLTVNAISKQKDIKNSVTTTETKKNAISEDVILKKQETHSTIQKETKMNSQLVIIGIILVPILILIIAFFIIKKYFPTWLNTL